MAEQPPLSRIHVVGYSANDRDFPILNLVLDPRVAGYQVPKDLSACPDKRYPNHVFTGAQPIAGDQRVRHVWEILPSPWVPFTRYDDDLGPVQGRRRSVKNEGQVASLSADNRTTYEAREGSAIVYTELEETWEIKVDEDGNSLFPIRDRDFYDASRGPVQERRQLFVPTGKEEGSLENVNGVITQTSYEPYNEFLSVKIVQTYRVDGPLLIGKATNNEGQLTTITTQRKGAKDYNPPNPTATRTVEVAREDAESLVERIIDTPEVFPQETKSAERPDLVPPKFRSTIPVITTEITIAGEIEEPALTNEIIGTDVNGIPIISIKLSKSEQQVTEFVKRVRTTSRRASSSRTLTGYQFTSELGGGQATITEKYPFYGPFFTDPETGTIERVVENLGDGTYLERKITLPEKNYSLEDSNFFAEGSGSVFIGKSLPILNGQEYDEELDIVIPYKQVVANPKQRELSIGERRRVTPRDVAHSTVIKYDIQDVQESLDEYYWEIPDMINIQLPNRLLSVGVAVNGESASSSAPSISGDTYSFSTTQRGGVGGTLHYDIEEGFNGVIPTIRAIFFLPKGSASPDNVLARVRLEKDNPDIKFWPNARPRSYQIAIVETSSFKEESQSVSFDSVSSSTSSGGDVRTKIGEIPPTIHTSLDIEQTGTIASGAGTLSITPDRLTATEIQRFTSGLYLYQINATPYKFSYVRVDALLVDLKQEYV